MDRGEDRDLLSSGFFDASHDRLDNKRHSQRQQQKEIEGEGGRDITSIQMHSAVQVSCSADQHNKPRLSSESPGRQLHKQNHSMKFERRDQISG